MNTPTGVNTPTSLYEKEKMSAQQCQLRVNEVNDESLNALRRMHEQSDRTKELGANTLERLNEQGEQLDNINKRLDQMDNDLASAEEDLDELNKCCGCCLIGKSRKKKNKKKHNMNYRNGQSENDDGDDDGVKKKKKKKKKKKNGESKDSSADSSYFKRRGMKSRSFDMSDEREAEMAEHVDAIDRNIADLKQQALAMNKELNRQNKQIDVTGSHVRYNTDRVRNINDGAEDLLDDKKNKKKYSRDDSDRGGGGGGGPSSWARSAYFN